MIIISCGIAIIFIALGIWRSKLPCTEDVKRAVEIFSQSDTTRIKIISCLGLNRTEIIKNTNYVNSPSTAVKSQPIVPETKKQIVEIRSSLVGFFHLSFETEKRPFVELGKNINKGDDVGLIICNLLHTADRIKSEVTGTVVEILLEDGQPVGYGQVLMRIEIQ